MNDRDVSFGDKHRDSLHRLSTPSIFRHRSGFDGNFLIAPIQLVDSEAPTAPSTPGPSPLVKKLTSNSLALQTSVRRELTKRKYAKYDRRRYDHGDVPEHPEQEGAAQEGAAGSAQAGYLGRGKAKAKTLLKRKHMMGMGKHEQDTTVDVLYENQRGGFFFGIPKYSSSSLLPRFDPRPWQNAQFRTSPVDIRNAQVPDPSWEWTWKSWYVDMSRDVDDEGWEYSLEFSAKSGWHGNHPWFHSWVRRRRWLRMRRRKESQHQTKEKAHQLTAEYFTIHPKTLRPASETLSKAADVDILRLERQLEDELEVEKMEIADIGSLELALKKASVDRQKLMAVRKFVDAGGDELYYLSERMPQIMGVLVFQSSRRQLLSELLNHFEQAREKRKVLQDHSHEDDTGGQEAHDTATRNAENLMRAVKAADEQVQKLEFWSDIKSMAEGGDTLKDETYWDASKWQGLSPADSEKHPQDSFANKQPASEGAPDLHKHAEHSEPESDSRQGSASVFYDAKENKPEASEAEESRDYTTAGESASDVSQRRRKKGKGRARLDGVAEDGALSDDASEHGDAEAGMPDLLAESKTHSVRLVEPVAVDDETAANSRPQDDGDAAADDVRPTSRTGFSS